jgi:DNA primase
MGTSLTETQARLLNRYVDTVIICYDGDDAGIEASYKASNILRNAGCEIRVTNLTGGADPDNFIREQGGEAFREKVIKTSDTFISFYMRYLKRSFNLSLKSDRIHYVEKVLQEIASLGSSVERESYLQELSNETGLSMDSLQDETASLSNRFKQSHTDKGKGARNYKQISFVQPKRLYPAFHNAERNLLAHMLHNPMITEKIRDELGASFNIDEHKIIATYLYAYYEEGNPADISMFIDRLEDQPLRETAIDLAMSPVDTDIGEKELQDYIRIIRAQSGSMSDIKLMKEQQRMAEQQSDPLAAA